VPARASVRMQQRRPQRRARPGSARAWAPSAPAAGAARRPAGTGWSRRSFELYTSEARHARQGIKKAELKAQQGQAGAGGPLNT